MPKQIDVYIHLEEVVADCNGCMFNIPKVDCPIDALNICTSNPGVIFKTEPSKPIFTVDCEAAEQSEER